MSPASARKRAIVEAADRMAGERAGWIARNRFFYEDEWRYMRFLVSPGLRVLELGCGGGGLLAALRPSRGVGVDLSPMMIEIARRDHPELEFHVGDAEDPELLARLGGPFDVIVLADTIGAIEDCQALLERLHGLCADDTRIVLAYFSQLWRPLLALAERIGQRMPHAPQNWLSTDDLAGLLGLADFEVVRTEWRQLLPKRLLGLGAAINRWLAPLPGIRRLCLRTYVVGRKQRGAALGRPSASIVVPCRNERGNIEPAVQRLPRFVDDLEIVFVEGHSRDGTYEECLRVQAAYPDRRIVVLRQDGVGKGDATRKGFAEARGDVLIILDADLTVPPEALPKFYDALVAGRGEMINGTRLVYPMEEGAMRFLNYLANRFFAKVFSYLLNQRFTDTLCGTKALTRRHYAMIARNRDYFGEFDPFGDFDLIFGAAKLSLRIVEIPVRYADRGYGETQISRFRHGWLLARMVLFAFRKLKAL